MLADLLKSMNFVDSVKVSDEENKLTDEEITMVEERWTAYKKNPKSAIPWEEVKTKISEKYSLN